MPAKRALIAWFKAAPVAAALLLAVAPARAGSRVSAGSGNWNAPGTWVPAGVPGIEDSVTILAGHTVTAASACSAGVLVIKGRDEGTGTGARFSNGTWPWRLYLRTAEGRTGSLVVEPGAIASGFFDQANGGWTTIEGDYLNGGVHTAGSVELVVNGVTVNNDSMYREGNATRDWVLRGGFTNNGSYTAMSAREPLTVGTAEAGGAFVNSGRFSNNGRSRLYFHGDFVNNQPDADFGREYVFFRGGTDSRIGGSGGAKFWKAAIEKDAPTATVTLDTTLVITEPSWGALIIQRGTLVTNGESLSVYTEYLGDAMTLGGGPEGRLLVRDGPGGRKSRVFVITLDQWDAPLGSVVVEDGLLSVREQHNLAGNAARFELRGGTVRYNRAGNGANFSALSFRPYDGPADGGWFATGGTAVFNNAGIYAAREARFVAGGSATVKFEGNRNSFITMAATAAASHSQWEFNEIVIARTGGAAVSFNSVQATTGDVKVARPFALAAGQALSLEGSFARGHGYRFGDVAIAAGATLSQTAEDLFIEGGWSNAGAFDHGSRQVSIVGPGVSAPLAPGGSAFHRLALDRPDGGVTLSGPLAVADELAVRAGRLELGPNVLALGTARSAGRVAVAGGGTLSALGTSPGLHSRVTAASTAHGYGFSVNPGGTVAARHATFERMDGSGIVVAGGAAVDPADNFSCCSFDRGSTAGPMLKLENGQVLTLREVFFTGSAGYNIEKLADSGRVTVDGGGGDRWGEEFENDPGNRVDWTTMSAEEGADRPPLPTAPAVGRVTPNPLVGTGELWLALPAAERVRVLLYDAGGRAVARVTEGVKPAGYHRLRLAAGLLADGAYLLRVEVGSHVETRKLVVQR